jgi:small nuclear ribonucleoprotein (snRNP)-like protein
VRSRIIASRLRDLVLVTLKSGESFSGVLYSFDKTALVLRAAEAIGQGERKTNLPLDGELLVLLENVAYIQRT